jgi:hypothetical protein
MKKNYWIIQTGICFAALIALTSCATTAKYQPRNHQIEVFLIGDKVAISQHNMIKLVKGTDSLQWKVRPGIPLKNIDIRFVDQKLVDGELDCKSTTSGDPCQNTLDKFKPVITCAIKPDVAPDPGDPEDHYDYCYAIDGKGNDGKVFDSLDPIVRGGRY